MISFHTLTWLWCPFHHEISISSKSCLTSANMRISAVVFLVVFAGVVYGYEDKTIAQWLSDNGFTTLVSVLKSANLYSVLGGTGKRFCLFDSYLVRILP